MASRRETYRIEVGHVHGIKPGNIVGAIANEAGLEGKFIGRVDIREDHSFVDLPEGMPKQIFRDLQKTRVGGQELRISSPPMRRARNTHSTRAPKPIDRHAVSASAAEKGFGENRTHANRSSISRPTGDRPHRAHQSA